MRPPPFSDKCPRRWAPERPARSPERLKRVARSTQEAPRSAQEVLRGSQQTPERPQETPRDTQEARGTATRPQRRPKRPPETVSSDDHTDVFLIIILAPPCSARGDNDPLPGLHALLSGFPPSLVHAVLPSSLFPPPSCCPYCSRNAAWGMVAWWYKCRAQVLEADSMQAESSDHRRWPPCNSSATCIFKPCPSLNNESARCSSARGAGARAKQNACILRGPKKTARKAPNIAMMMAIIRRRGRTSRRHASARLHGGAQQGTDQELITAI